MLAPHSCLSNSLGRDAIDFMRKLAKQISIWIWFSLPLLFGTGVFAQVDPKIEWKVMKLPHFDLMYDAKHQELANLYADRLEDSYQVLSTYFERLPRRTVVVLNDRTDLTNGYATAIPYRTIGVYPVLPGPNDTISDFGDWARELSLHELTHVLSFEPRRGIVTGLYSTFGNIITPNLLLPRWFLEGVAVDLETRTSENGRLRSPYQDAMIRAMYLDQTLFQVQLAEINETSIHTWPQGARPYLFGSLMWSELITRHGQKLIAELHGQYGGRVPFLIDTPLLEKAGKNYEQLFSETQTELVQRAKKQADTLAKVPFTAGTELQFPRAVENFSPMISPDGRKMIFLSKNAANKRSVRILERPSIHIPFDASHEKAEIKQRFGETLPEMNPAPRGLDEHGHDDAPPGGTIHRLSWFADSRKFIFDKLDSINRFSERSDLYTFDLEAMKVERLTRNERAREASVSPNSQLVTFVKLDAGRTHLGLLAMDSRKTRILHSPPLQARISHPTFINEDEIIFSERFQGRESLRIYSLSRGSLRNELPNHPNARFPFRTPSGIAFNSALNGTSNLYLASEDLKTARPLTHTSTFMAASTYDESRQEAYVSELTSRGFQIRRVSLAQTKLPAELPKIEPMMADRYPKPDPRPVPVIEKPEPEPYRIGSYLLPHYWLPNFYFYDGGAQIGGMTSGTDPLGKHTYSLTAVYDTQPKETSFNFLYLNNTTEALIQLQALDFKTSLINTSIEFRQQQYDLASLWEITALSPDFYLGLGLRWLGRDYSIPDNLKTESFGPTMLANYSDLNMSGAQISPESGQSFQFSAAEFLQGGEQSEDFRLVQASLQKYFSKWLPERHAIMTRLQGQFIDKNITIANAGISVANNPFLNTLPPFYIMRGYLNGQFLGKSLANYSFEYRFPLQYTYRGSGTTPLFIKRLHAAVIADGLTVDGFSYNQQASVYERVPSWRSFWSAGAEVKADVTLGYHFPVTFYLGAYAPLDRKYREGQNIAIGIQL